MIKVKNFKKLNHAALNNDDLLDLKITGMNIISNFAYPIICKDKKTFENYKQLFQENNIEIRPIIGGSMIEQPFFKKYVSKDYNCPNASLVHKNGFYVPNRPDLISDEIELMVNLLKK